MTTPLDGLRVLDVSFGLPGAVASMILADYGADVVHVDPPAGVGPAFVTAPWDRGRRRVRADLRLPDLLARFLELAAGADVVIVGLAPSSARRLGLDRESILAVNPDVIYVGLTGFGLDSDRAVEGLDSLVAAELGAMVTATPARRDGPVVLGHPAVAYSTALVAVIGILAAVRARVAGGRGDVLDVSLQDGLLAQFTMNWWTEQNVSFLADRRAEPAPPSRGCRRRRRRLRVDTLLDPRKGDHRIVLLCTHQDAPLNSAVREPTLLAVR